LKGPTFFSEQGPAESKSGPVHRTQLIEIFGNVSTPLVPWPSIDIHVKFYGDSLRETPPWGLNARGVAKYSDFGHFVGYISETVQCMIKLILITNWKSHISFRLVPNSVTLNGVIAPKFALFHGIR